MSIGFEASSVHEAKTSMMSSSFHLHEDSPLGCGPTTRGLRQRQAGNFGGVLSSCLWRIGALRTVEGKSSTIGQKPQVHVLSVCWQRIRLGLTFWRLQ